MSEVIDVSLSRELVTDFLSYSTAIFNRALPDIVDGLKTVQRRALVGMADLSLRSNGPYCKVSRLEGHVLGKYHPQGSCSGSVINMGQHAAMRYVLTDIHGNAGGSIQSGEAVGQLISEDPPAAARYLEVRATPFCEQVYLSQMDRGLGSWRPNYDDTTTEPVRFVPVLPMILLTGAQGIASGYACSHIPYNIKDVIGFTTSWIKNKKLTDSQIFQKFTAPPEPPQGGRVVKNDDLKEVILNGRGSVTVYGEWEKDDKLPWGKRSTRPALIVTRLANGSSEKFLERVRDLADKEKLPGLIDAADYSSRDGIRIVLVTRTNTDRDHALSVLLASSGLVHSYSVNATAVGLDGMPKTIGVRDAVETWYGERVSYLCQKHKAEADKLAQERERLQGVVKVLSDVEKFIRTVRTAKSKDLAVEKISKTWKLSIEVSKYLITIPISTLIATEAAKVTEQLNNIATLITELTELSHPGDKLDQYICAQIASQRGLCGPGRAVWMAEGVPTTPEVKRPLTERERIVEEGKSIGLTARTVNAWIKDNMGKGNISALWEKYKSEYKHRIQMTTRAGKKERKEELAKLKAYAESKGLPSRGSSAWNAFITPRSHLRIDDIRVELENWISNHARKGKPNTRASSPSGTRSKTTSVSKRNTRTAGKKQSPSGRRKSLRTS